MVQIEGAGETSSGSGGLCLRAHALVLVIVLSASAPLALAGAFADRLDQEGHAVGFAATAPLAGPLAWSATGLPPGIDILTDGTVSGVLSFDAAGDHAVALTATGGEGSWSGGFTWTVVDVNRPPRVESQGAVFARVGEPVAVQLRASDPDGDVLAFTASGLPNGLALEGATGLLSGVPTSAGVFLVGVQVSDAGHASSLTAQYGFPLVVTAPAAAPNAAPRCDAAAPSVAALWPPNGRMQAIGVLGVVDPDGDALRIRVTDIASNEPARTAGSGSDTAWLEAARAGSGAGREYVVSFAAEDARGGSCGASVVVRVPHDRGRAAG